MKQFETIEPETQEAILDALPQDGYLALSIMSQLVANMIISIDRANLTSFVESLKDNIKNYEGT